jgi:hypothetical protein
MSRDNRVLRVPKPKFNYNVIFQWKANNIYPIAYVLNPHSEWSNILMTVYIKLHNLDEHTRNFYLFLSLPLLIPQNFISYDGPAREANNNLCGGWEENF